MKCLEFLLSLRPSLPMSKERPCQPASNSEVRRWLEQGAVHINGQPARPADEIGPGDVESLVLFPKAPRSRCTLV